MLLAQQDSRPLVEFTSAPLFEEYGIPLAVMGILVVFLALVLVVVFITLLPRVLGGISAPQPGRAAASPLGEGELPEELVAVITAAVAESLGRPHRIVKIRGLTPADLGWSLEGRMQHHHSHRIQRRDRR
jgi:Na+-transporting methylmalonyl-CoA/oxaloacetate decarboxylase gamma subunit